MVVHAAVRHDEGLAPRLLHVDGPRDVDAGVGHQVAPELEEEAAPFQARVGAVGGQQLPEAPGEGVEVELGHLLEVGDPEAPAEVDHLKGMSGEVRRLKRDLQDVAAVLQQGLHLEDLGRRVDVHAAQGQFVPAQRLPDGLPKLGLIHTELAYRPAHAHPRAHELGLRVDPESHPDALACLPGYVGEAVDLAQRLDVDGEDAFVDGAPELVVGLAGTGEDDILGLEAGGPRHREFPGGGDLGPGLPLRGNELAHPEAGVRLHGVGDLRP